MPGTSKVDRSAQRPELSRASLAASLRSGHGCQFRSSDARRKSLWSCGQVEAAGIEQTVPNKPNSEQRWKDLKESRAETVKETPGESLKGFKKSFEKKWMR